MLPSHASGACKQHAQPKRTLNVSIQRADIRTQLAHANHIFDIGSGKPHYPIHFVDVSTNDGIFDEYQENFDMSWRQMRVHYTTENCTQHKGTIKLEGVNALERSEIVYRYSYPSAYRVGDCSMGKDVICTLHEQTASKCRLNVRMSAAFVLMGCLVIKAVYMCAVNLLARGKVKQHCLTFGDVIVASAADPELRLQGSVFSFHTIS